MPSQGSNRGSIPSGGINFMLLTSQDNSKIKFLKKLNQKKYRDESGQFLVENFLIIRDAAKSGIFFESLFVTKKFIEKNQSEFNWLLKKVGTKNYFTINEKTNNYFSSLETPAGVAAVYSRIPSRLDFNLPVVYLNRISDPGNLGTILRSALAFGFTNIVVDEFCVDLYNPKAISAAKDAIFKLNLSLDQNLKIISQIKSQMPIVTTSLSGAGDLKSLEKYPRFCLVFCNEAAGVDAKIAALSSMSVKIKMSNKIESLNVAVAAGIIFFSLFGKD